MGFSAAAAGNLNQVSGTSVSVQSTTTTSGAGSISYSILPSGTNLNGASYEWSLLYRTTTTTGNIVDLQNGTPASNRAGWRYWLNCTDAVPTSTSQGFYVTQIGNAIVVRARNSNYNTDIISYTLPTTTTTNPVYNIKVQRKYQSGTVYWYLAVGESNATTPETYISAGFNGSSVTQYNTYNYTVLESYSRIATNGIFRWDDLKLYTTVLNVTGLNTAANGITQSSTLYTGSSYALFGFDVNPRGLTYFEQQRVLVSGIDNISKLFSSFSLVLSTDNIYSSDDAVVTTTTDITSSAIRFANFKQGYGTSDLTSHYYYFLVGTVKSSIATGDMGSNVQFKFDSGGNATDGAFVNNSSAPYTPYYSFNSWNIVNSITYTFGTPTDWTGAYNTNWNDSRNWSPAAVPTSSTLVRIGVTTGTITGSTASGSLNNGSSGTSFISQPTVNASATCAQIILGTAKAITLTVTNTLAVSGAITQNHNTTTSNVTTTLTGGGTLTASSFTVGDASTPPAPSGESFFGTGGPKTVTTTINSDVTTMTISGTINLNTTSSALGNYTTFYIPQTGYSVNNAYFYQNGGTLTAGNLTTTNTSYTANNAAIFSTDNTSANTTLNLTGATPISVATGGTIDFTNNGSGTGTVNYSATSGTQTVYTTADAIGVVDYNYDNLTLSGAAAKTVTGGALTVGAAMNTSGGAVSLANNPTITVTGSWANSAVVTQNTGSITVASTTNNGTFNGGGGTFTTSSGLLINNGTFNASTGTITTAQTLNNQGTFNASSGTIAVGTNFNNNTSGAIFNAGTGQITVTGNFTNNGTYTGSTGNIDVNGTTFTNTGTLTLAGGTANISSTTFTNTSPGTFIASAGTVNFDRGSTQSIINTNTATPVTFQDLTFSGSNTKTFNPTPASQTGKFNVNSTGTITLSGTATVAAGDGFLTLKSDANSTARLAQLTSTNNTISGNVNVERWFTGGVAANRGWRLMSSPVNNTSTAQLAANGSTATSAAFNFSSLKTNMLVTGSGGSGQGFDQPTGYTANGSTILFYTQLSTGYGSRFDGPASIISTRGVGSGFYFYFRGDRSNATGKLIRTGNNPYPAPEADVVGLQTGYLNQHSFRYALGNIGRKFNLVGNPYPSSIVLPAANMVGTTGWVYTFAPGGNSIGTGNPAAAVTLASGQGFFVVANNNTTYINFTESLKTASQPSGSSLLMGTPLDTEEPMITLKMIQDDNNWDISYLRFLDSYKDTFYDMEDAEDFDGPNQATLFSALTSDKKLVAVASQPLGKQRTSVFLSVDDTATGIYKIQRTGLVGIPAEFDVYLMDHFKKDSLDLRANDTYNFNLDKTNPASFGTERFEVVIRKKILPPYKLVSFTGKKAGTNVTLRWDTQNEFDYTSFELQKSTDNKTFDAVRNSRSTSSGTYTYTDNFLATDTQPIYYRLKQTDIYDNVTYSKVVIIVTNGDGKLSLYPNPASNSIQFVLAKPIKSKVNLRIYNAMGILVKTGTFASETGQQDISSLTTGSYTIEIVDASTKETVLTGKFVKL
ncbi:T9SS type A sorting domain-containing protein [Mucilaginibacter pedocola]|nr:T9SS type A sorting domain-containing protein [Mucilaginibacter pedocola]